MDAQFYGPTGEVMFEAVVSESTTAEDIVVAFRTGRWRAVLGGVLHVSPVGIVNQAATPSDEASPVDPVAASEANDQAEHDGTP